MAREFQNRFNEKFTSKKNINQLIRDININIIFIQQSADLRQ